jgi:osmotically-inducible protein OsmY
LLAARSSLLAPRGSRRPGSSTLQIGESKRPDVKKRRQIGAVAFVLACVLSAACGSTIAATSDDATLTTRVKTALLSDGGFDVVRIEVSTSNRIVTLAGRVRSRQEEARAVALARSVRGVVDVKSTLLIDP